MREALRICQPAEQDRPLLKQIWTETFQDPPELVERFFAFYPPEQSAWLVQDCGRIVSTAYLLTGNRFVAGNQSAAAAYVYAVATPKEHRGKGYGSMLMRHFAQTSQNDGSILYTRPASRELFRWYEQSMHTKPAGFSREETIRASGEPCVKPVKQMNGTAYGEMRERALAETPHLVLSNPFLQLQEVFLNAENGGFYAVENCCCACEYAEGEIFIKELLGPAEARCTAIDSLIRRFHAKQARIRIPEPFSEPLVACCSENDLTTTNWGLLLD